MSHTTHNKHALLTRLRRIAGQVAALERAIEDEEECGRVLIQMAAAKGALHALMMEVLAGQLQGHVIEQDDLEQRRAEAEPLLALLRGHLK